MEQSKSLFPNRLHEHRRIFGYKKKQVAFLIGIRNPADITKWERGTSLPSTATLLKLSIVYRTFPNALYQQYMHDLKEIILNREEQLKH
jgi:transcriptional regulator with XRE-family HTH domain